MHIGVVSNQVYNHNSNKLSSKPAFGSVIPVVVKLDGKILPHSQETSNFITRFVKLFNSRKFGENNEKIIGVFREVDKDFYGEIASIRGVKSDVLRSSNGSFWTNLGKNFWINTNGEYSKINEKFLSNFHTDRQWLSPKNILWEYIKPNVWVRHLITNQNDIENMQILGKMNGTRNKGLPNYEKGIVDLIKSAKKRITGIKYFVIEANTTGVIKHRNGTETPKTKIMDAYFVPITPPAPPKPQKPVQLEFDF